MSLGAAEGFQRPVRGTRRIYDRTKLSVTQYRYKFFLKSSEAAEGDGRTRLQFMARLMHLSM